MIFSIVLISGGFGGLLVLAPGRLRRCVSVAVRDQGANAWAREDVRGHVRGAAERGGVQRRVAPTYEQHKFGSHAPLSMFCPLWVPVSSRFSGGRFR